MASWTRPYFIIANWFESERLADIFLRLGVDCYSSVLEINSGPVGRAWKTVGLAHP